MKFESLWSKDRNYKIIKSTSVKLKIEKGQYDEQWMAVYYTSHFALMVKALNVGYQGHSIYYSQDKPWSFIQSTEF